ncbi:hypothetical protein GCM10020295_75090 [Streptomyces cinereospinus]
MSPRLLHRLGRCLATALISSLCVGGLSSAPAAAAPRAAELPPQEPGVTLRVFDVQVPLDGLCALKPGQTPNIDKLMPVIDWSSAADFGMESRFVTHVLGNLAAPGAGTYAFRLTSDDGSRLWIDDQLVVDHDGLHGAEPKDGTVQLTAATTPCASSTSNGTAASSSPWHGGRPAPPASPSCRTPRSVRTRAWSG